MGDRSLRQKRSDRKDATHETSSTPHHDILLPQPQADIVELQRVIGNAAVLRQLNEGGAVPSATGWLIQRDDTDVSEPLSENSEVSLDPQLLDTFTLEELADLKQIIEHDLLNMQQDEHFEQASFDTAKGNFATVQQVIAAKLEGRFNEITEAKTLGVPDNPKERIEFLDVLSVYLGSYDAVIDHYKNVQKADFPGSPVLHANARAQLEAVKTELGGEVPGTTVAASLRGRYHAKDREPMGHVMGFALDYRATTNPRIGDNDTLTLLRMDTGGKVNIDMGMSREERRAFIGEMQAGTAADKDMEKYFERFEAEYERVSAASKHFGDKLGTDARADMRDLRQRYFQNLVEKHQHSRRLKEIERSLKRKKNDPEALMSLMTEAEALNDDLEAVELDQQAILEETQDVIQPWLDEIQTRKEQIEDKNPDVFNGEPVNEKTLSKKEKKRREYARGEWKAYDSLEKRLTTDLSFLFGKLQTDGKGRVKRDKSGDPKMNVVSQPSAAQLLELGFFNPDAEPQGKFNPDHHGFNLEFMEAMARHGFDQGVCWNGASQDSMHFEYVPDYDRIIGGSKEQKQKRLSDLNRLKAIYYGKKKQAARKKKKRK